MNYHRIRVYHMKKKVLTTKSKLETGLDFKIMIQLIKDQDPYKMQPKINKNKKSQSKGN